MKSQRRKIVLINKRFQISMIIKFILVNIAIIALFSFFIYLFLDSEIDANLKSAHTKYQNMKDMLIPIVFSLSVINVLISSIIITIFVLLASFRIAGPLYRINEIVSELISGNLKPFTKIRKKDQLCSLAKNLELVSEQFRNDFYQLKAALDHLKEIRDENHSESLEKAIESMEKIIHRYDF